uniref:Reverse transcriptase Ty1/copia-type domain-containing protein n=1 Tax=Lactuca sativa TaxID=4236 RepID=A0A9R1W2V9_LACSA|nr:hypothetical protein LSAT_V11C300135750 [Lactuca sativa]
MSNRMDEDGIMIRNKSRLVAQGFCQLEGLDYDKTFARVSILEAIRPFLDFALFKKFKVYQIDIKTTFLHEDLQEEVFRKQPPWFEIEEFPNLVYRLDKPFYDLKQAPRTWYDTLASYLLESGYKRGKIYNTLFIKHPESHIILSKVYVDDIIFGLTDKKLRLEFAEIMAKKFKMSMMGELTFFLGLQAKQLTSKLILKKFGFYYYKPAKTPMSSSLSIDTDVNATLYRGITGSLLYLTSSLPDIMFATILCDRYQANPKESHLLVVKRIFRYLKNTPNLGLWYPHDFEFKWVGYTGSDHGGCVIDRKSTSGGA